MSELKLILIKSSIDRSKKFCISDGVSFEQYNEFGTYPSLGLLYLAASVRELCETEVIDPDIVKLKTSLLAKKICEKKPDIIGIHIMSFTFLYALELAKAIKKYGNPLIIIGGPHVDLYPKEIIKHSCFDIGVLGEGEQTLKELVSCIKSGRDYSNVKGIVFMKKTEYIETPKREVINNLDLMPFPARDLININNYYQPVMTKPFITTISSRGCPYYCVYCSKTFTTSHYRLHSPQYMLEEIIECKKKYGIKSVHYFDDTFNVNKNRVIDFCNLLIKNRLNIIFSIRARADNFDEEIVKSLRNAGCTQICFGVESGDPEILEKMNKKVTLQQVKKAFSLCHKYKISPIAFFMVGYPDEKREHIENTIKLIKEIKPEWFKANILTPYPGSKLYNNLLKDGVIDDFWKKITLEGRPYPAPNISKYFTYHELEHYRQKINSMPYFRFGTNLLKFAKLKYIKDGIKALKLLARTMH